MISTLTVAKSQISITRVGFGCARIHGGTEFKASARLIEAALEAGIRHFDTAPSYGCGQSESVLGTVLTGMKDVTIATKIGISRPDKAPMTYAWPVLYRKFLRPVLSCLPGPKAKLLQMLGRTKDAEVGEGPARRRLLLTREEVLRGLDDSLKQLRRSRVNLFLIHEPDQFELTDELKHTFELLMRDGAIGAYGLAWARVADRGVGFGSVVQGRYKDSLAAEVIEGETRILHGVLRHAGRDPNGIINGHGPGIRIRKVLDAHRDAAVIFSGSVPKQIRSVMEHVR